MQSAVASQPTSRELGILRQDARHLPHFGRPDVDVFICGETREWELVEEVRDSITAGNKKALILSGQVVSEQGGMIYCADWLRSYRFYSGQGAVLDP